MPDSSPRSGRGRRRSAIEALTFDILPISATGSGFIEPVAAGPIVRTVLGSTVQTPSGRYAPVMVQLGVSRRGAGGHEGRDPQLGYRYIDGGELPDALSEQSHDHNAFGEHGETPAGAGITPSRSEDRPDGPAWASQTCSS
jgi:hypothetical protein